MKPLLCAHLMLGVLGYGLIAPAQTVSFSEIWALPVSGDPKEIRAVELNGDGRLDFVVTSPPSRALDIYLNCGPDCFELAPFAHTSGDRVNSVCAGDFDRDGWADLVVANDQGSNLSFLFNRGLDSAGNWMGFQHELFSVSPSRNVGRVTVGDFNDDGWDDVVAVCSGSHDVLLIANSGVLFPGFRAPKVVDHNVAFPQDLVQGDFDGNGLLDIAILETGLHQHGVWVLWNYAAPACSGSAFPGPEPCLARKVPVIMTPHPTGLAALDANDDGRMDLALSDGDGPVVILMDVAGNRMFSTMVKLPFWWGCRDIASGDFNHDRMDDLAVVWGNVGGTPVVSVALNLLGTGHFSPYDVHDFRTHGMVPTVVVASDLDHDGYDDVLVGHQTGPGGSQDVSVLRNEGDPNQVRFVRGDANRDGAFSSLVDATFLLAHHFIPGSPALSCPDAADADDDGTVHPMMDALFILRVQFEPGSSLPPPPFPWPGSDPTPDPLGPCR